MKRLVLLSLLGVTLMFLTFDWVKAERFEAIFTPNIEMFGHKVMVRTLDLNKQWKSIHKDLIDILETA